MLKHTATQRRRYEVPLLQWQTWKARHWEHSDYGFVLNPAKRCFVASAPYSRVFQHMVSTLIGKQAMPLFGSKSSFAVEANAIEPNQRPHYPGIIFGHFCFWVAGQRLGNYDDPNILGTPAATLSGKLAFQGRRNDIAVDGKNKEEVLAIIYDALYEPGTAGEEKTYPECIQLSKRFTKFDICTNSSEALDGIFAVLVDVDDGSRFIWREHKNQNVQEVKLAAGEYEAAIRAFLKWHGLTRLARSTGYKNY